MEKFVDLLNESYINEETLNNYVVGSCLGLFHKKLCENVLIPEACTDLVELVMTMVQKGVLPKDFDVAITDICSDFISEDIHDDIPWTLFDTKCIIENAPWCVDEDGYIIEEEFNDLTETDFDKDGKNDIKLDAESKKSLNKRMKNPKTGASFTVKKNYDKYAGLSKKQIRDGFIRCPPGTQGEGKIRKKGRCNKRTDPNLTRKLKKSAVTNKASRKRAAKKAAKTRKRTSGRRRAE